MKEGIKINVMKNKVQIKLIILGIIFLNANIFAQTEEWETEITDDGKITMKYNISERTDENGDEVQLLEYIATTTDSVSMQNCISVIKDVSKHKEFSEGTEVSKKVKTISDNEWIVYYYNDLPWPIPNSDCVMKMNFSEDTTKNMATFTFTAAPSMFEKKDVDRCTYNNGTYVFKNLGNGKVEFTVTGKMSPVFQAPAWMARGWFPDGPAEEIRAILKLAKSN